MIDALWQIEFERPYFLLLLFLLFAGVLWRGYGRSYIVKIYRGKEADHTLSKYTATRTGIGFLSLALIVFAMADPTRGYSLTEEKQSTNTIYIAVDNSSSTYNFDTRSDVPIYCSDKDLIDSYPNIYKECLVLMRIIDETEKFANANSVKNKIALLRFAQYSAVQVYPTDDYALLRRTVKTDMNWRAYKQIGIHTEIHLALLDMFNLLLMQRVDSGSAPSLKGIEDEEAPLLSFEESEILIRSFVPEGENIHLSIPRSLKEKISKLKEKVRHAVFIIVTDGLKNQLKTRFDKEPVSLKKMLEFAEMLELPVYFISTEDINQDYLRYARRTGFGKMGGPNRGNFVLVSSGNAKAFIHKTIDNVLKTRYGRTSSYKILRRESYSVPIAALSLLFFGLWVLFGKIIRSLTET